MSDSDDTNKIVDGDDASHSNGAERQDPIDEAVEQELDDEAADIEHEDTQSSDEESQADDALEQDAEPVKAEENTKKSSGAGLAWFALLLAIAASGLSGYMFWQQTTSGQARATAIDNNQLQLSSMKSSLTQQESQISTVEQRINNAIAEVEAAKTNAASDIETMRKEVKAAQQLLDSHARRLLSLTATTTDDWRIAEVDYLLRLANQRILISHDGVTAFNLLATADKILLELGDPRLFEVRKAIAEDMAALTVVRPVDSDGIFLALAGLVKQVDRLPIISAPVFERELVVADAPNAVQTDDQKDEAQVKAWYASVLAILNAGWQEVRSWLVINKQDAEIKPLLPPEQQYYLRGNLKILLNQAQLALLESKAIPYTTSLNTSIDWIERYFPMQEVANKRVVEALRRLSEINIAPEYPDLSESLLTVKAFIHGQHAQVVEGSNVETSSVEDSSAEDAKTETAKTVEGGE